MPGSSTVKVDMNALIATGEALQELADEMAARERTDEKSKNAPPDVRAAIAKKRSQ